MTTPIVVTRSKSGVIHTFNYIDLTYNSGNSVNIKDITNLTNMLGIQNQISAANLQNAIDILLRDYNFFLAMTQLYNLITGHSSYELSDSSTADSLKIALYDEYGAESSDTTLTDSKFFDVTIASAYTFLKNTEQLLTLSNNLSKNGQLNNSYVSSTNKSIAKKLLYYRSLVLAYAYDATEVTATDINTSSLSYDVTADGDSVGFQYGFCPMFNVWPSSAPITNNGYLYTTYFESLKAYISPITSYDVLFLRFFSRILTVGISNLLTDIDNQNTMTTSGINVLQVVSVLGIVLDVTVFADSDITLLAADPRFVLYVSTVQRVLNFCIPIINDVKNKVLMNGLPSYYITYCLFVLCMLNIRNDMITMASLNLDTIASGTYENNVGFYIVDSAVDLTIPTSTLLFSQVGFI